MADQQDNAIEALEAPFQRLDHGHVEMVGRLVQQQHIRFTCKGLGQCRPALLPARQGGGVSRAVHAELHQLCFGHVTGFQAL